MGRSSEPLSNMETVDSSIRSLLQEIKKHIVTIRMLGNQSSEFFDQGEAMNTLFHEAYDAKQKAKKVDELIESSGLTNYQSRLWKLDDQRSFESRRAWVRIRRRAHGMPISSGAQYVYSDVFVYDECDIMGNRFVYSLTIKNNTEFVITNVTSTLVGYPRDCMRLVTDNVKKDTRLGAGDIVTQKFILTPSEDCVEGRLSSVVSYIDHKDRLITIRVEPFTITSVCDLLRPLKATSKQLEDNLHELVCSDQELILDWNVEILLNKSKNLLPSMNFYLVDVDKKDMGDNVNGLIRGFALGKYTSKRVAVVIHLEGGKDAQQTRARVEVMGDDSAMLPTTMEELIEKMDAWVCLGCGARLTHEQIIKIELKQSYECRYCGNVLTLDLYSQSGEKPPRASTYGEENIALDGDLETQKGMPSTEMGASSSTQYSDSKARRIIEGLRVQRGCDVVGREFVYKVKVTNRSEFVITSVTVTIVAYPNDTLSLDSESAKSIGRIEVGGFRSPEFIFRPTKDCVEGNILATVSLIDYKDNLHTLTVEPYKIRSVCDMLQPLESTAVDFELILKRLDQEIQDYKADWNPEILYRRVNMILPAKNFFIVDTNREVRGTHFHGSIRGFAEGKYTHKKVAAIFSITGSLSSNESKLQVKVLGEDISMLPVTLDELRESVQRWTCLHCNTSLKQDQLLKLKARVPIECSSCGRSLSIELYQKSEKTT